MSLYNPISFFFALTMCAVIAMQFGALFSGSQLVWLVLAAELYVFYRVYSAFKERTPERSRWYPVIFYAFVFATIASVVLIGMVSPLGGMTALISLLTV
ncbi:MAG: hypothetical protein MPJ78_01560 [Hyphomicrobiaceae bacterium]|nr:hypothetical protein [Hyphomicrobiaceae bacterium]